MIAKNKIVIGALGVALIAVAGGGGYFYYRYQQAQNEILGIQTQNNSANQAQTEVKKWVAEVSKLMELPEGEEPTVATVSDINKLKEQPFFQKAKNGDKVLIYSNAKEAILYDPQLQKIVTVAPINIGSESAQPVTSASPLASVRIVVRNGTNVSGLASKLAPEIQKDLPNSTIAGKENAASFGYEKTIIVVLNDQAASQAQTLSTTFGGTVTSLPPGEPKPDNADLLLILGMDKAE